MIINLEALTDIEIEGIDYSDYPDFCDAFMTYAYDKKLKRELTDEEIDDINNNHSSFVYEHVLEKVTSSEL